MEDQNIKFAVGYFKVDDLDNQEEIQRQTRLIGDHCALHGLNLLVTFGDEKATGKNFSGIGWNKMESMVKFTNIISAGMIDTLVVPSADMLSKDVSLYLLKERELNQNGLSIDIANSRGLDLKQNEIFLN